MSRGALCAALAAALAVSGAPLAAQVVNGDFEADAGFFVLAHGWSAFGGRKLEAVWDPGRVFTQGVTDLGPEHRAGVYQIIPVTPAARYRLRVTAKVQSPDLTVAIGVASDGGVSDSSALFGAPGNGTDWQEVSTEFTAEGDRATVFLSCGNAKPWPVYGWCQFDGVVAELLSQGNVPPRAVAIASPSSGVAPLGVLFDAGESSDADGDPLGYLWNFGDGSAASGESVFHTYLDAGEYGVTLSIDDGHGGTDTAGIVIRVLHEPGPTGEDLSENGDFEAGFVDGVASGWRAWLAAGEGYWKPSSRLGRIGSGSYASGNQVFDAVVRLNPKIVLLEGNALGMASAVRAALPDALIVGRLYIDHRVPEFLSDPERFGRQHAESCIAQKRPEVNAWQGMNEPFLNDVDNARRVARFEKAFSDRLQALGAKSVVFNIAVGNPGDVEIMLLPEIVDTLASADYVGYHAYGGIDDQLMVGPQSEWFAHRWRLYARMYDDAGLRMPPVIYTEATTFFAWKAGHTPPGFPPFEPWQIRDDLMAFERESRTDPWAVGLAVFLLGSSSPMWDGWEVSNEPVIYEGAGDHNREHPADARSGYFSQQFGSNGEAFNGGIVQAVSVEPGNDYRITTSMKLETFGPGQRVAYRVGYDTSGQTVTGDAATIVWSPDMIAGEGRETDIWYTASHDFHATASTVSVWIAGAADGVVPFRLSVDDVKVQKQN